MNSPKQNGSWRRSRRLCGVGLFVAGALGALAAPGAAFAAENLPPLQPLVQDLQTGSRPCASGADKAYVPTPPTVSAVLYDPEEDNQPAEANLVKGEFEAWWTGPDGVEQRRTHTTPATLSGYRQQWRMPADLLADVPADTTVSWRVRADDGTATSAWSSEGTGFACDFVQDTENPAAPVVTSADYPDDGAWHDGVGVYGAFTVDSPSPDVASYVYSFIGGPQVTARPDELGGPLTIRHLPLKAAPDYLTVRALDRAGRSSGTVTHFFRVQSGRTPVARWTLADAPGSTTAAAESGPAARAGSGVTFGATAPRGTALTSTAELDGGDQAFLTPDAPAVDVRDTFAVGAWVRPSRTDRTMTVAAQDAGDSTGSGSGFALGLRVEDDRPVWSFDFAGARVSGGAPETGEWAHLLALYDVETGKAQLYVNGEPVGTAVPVEPADSAGTADSAGDLQIGRIRQDGDHRQQWQGTLGDVRAYDRVVVPDEVTQLAYRKPALLGHWSLENASDGASPEQNGGDPLRLGAGASIHRGPDGSCIPDLDPDCPDVPYALVGDGHLQLDGENGYAAAAGPVVDTSDSFTVGVVVRLADADPAGPMTVLSQAGEHTDAFKVRYDPAAHAWQLIVPHEDAAGATQSVVSQVVPADGGEGQGHQIAVVYDDASDRITLYVDGNAGADATAALPDGWRGSGALQIGRARSGDGWGEYLHGDVDEVQAYQGALRARDISGLGHGTDPCICL
ncbi:LamG domain-containing protein [Streptomyces sp. NBC_01275]|uniref:LamG domain-containing protein n=1 Tax=Streptomyces sp. NBC_01275 TaxID=2903807 RepID=UPI00225C1E83|nr:LamG domain-containing protein [Streptomyces sp. NBC_01275]MCX4765794.1 LamG domain-containing protein [Streptomyces sp. NBC_01275]